LPKLLLFLARHAILDQHHKLSEQVIGQAVFGKRHHFDPAEDSSVRVNVRQLRLKLHEYYQTPGLNEDLIVRLPKGGYTLEFVSANTTTSLRPPEITEAAPIVEQKRWARLEVLLGICSAALLVACIVCAVGWHRSATEHEPEVPWPVSSVVHSGGLTTMVLADAGTSLRMLGDKELSLDSYIDQSYLPPILPKHMTDEEARLFRYLGSTRITSEADASAAAILSSVAGKLSENIVVRSARDLNSNDLLRGDFIFVGSRTSNPWVELVESRMNFHLFEEHPAGERYILNRSPKAGEQSTYRSSSLGTLASGEDYAVIALVPARSGGGSWLLFEGVRMEGSSAAISLMKTAAGRSKLESSLSNLGGGHPPKYFEALIRAQSVAGATMSVDVVATRSIQP
jgi:hypothetical protein